MILSQTVVFFMTPHASLYHRLASTQQTLRIQTHVYFYQLPSSRGPRIFTTSFTMSFFYIAFTPFHSLHYVHAFGLWKCSDILFASPSIRLDLTPSWICCVLLASLFSLTWLASTTKLNENKRCYITLSERPDSSKPMRDTRPCRSADAERGSPKNDCLRLERLIKQV